MRLIKIEDGLDKGRSHSLSGMKEDESSGLRDHHGLKTSEPGEMLPSQFMTIQRVPDVNKGFLNNSTLLTSGELLVDINGDLISSSAIPLEKYIPQQYEDDLLHDDLTEDDKRLAAALVAVQLVNQQKQQSGSHILPMLTQTPLPAGTKLVTVNDQLSVMPPLSGPNKPVPSGTADLAAAASGLAVNKPTAGMVNMVASYIQAVEGETNAVANPDQQMPLLKKALTRSRYLRPHLTQIVEQEAHLDSLDIHTEGEPIEISSEEIEIGNSEVIKTELSDYIIQEETSIKVEVCDMLSDDEQDSDALANDSDSTTVLDTLQRRNSLPHKKRIPRKLKHPKKSSLPRHVMLNTFKCNKCNEYFTSPGEYNAHKVSHSHSHASHGSHSAKSATPAVTSYTCELCFKLFTNQWKFFEHLKFHYEPLELETSSARPATQQQSPGKVIMVQADSHPKKEAKASPLKLRVAQNTPALALHNNKITMLRSKGAVSERWVSTSQLPDVTITPTVVHQPLTAAGGEVEPQHRQEQQQQQQPRQQVPTLWECQPCKRVFRRQKTFETHMSVAHPKEEEIEEFSEPEDMMEGIRVQVHSDDDKEAADKTGAVQKEWYREEDLHAAEEDIRELEEDNKNAYGEGNMCELCSEVFDSKRHLNQHIMQNHSELITTFTKTTRRSADGSARKGNLTCKQCGRLFHYRNSLVYHLKSHLGERPHQCEVCGKSFFATNALKVHMRQHSGSKPFKCEFCGRNFRQWGDLKYHCISIHSDQKNFQCEYCGKDFARKYSLTVHSRIHTGERNYQCEFCEKSFRASTYLQNHRRIHTGEKPHPCEVCGKPFRVRSDMKRHMVTHSKEPYSAYHLVKTKTESDVPSSPESKLLVQVEPQISEISKVEEELEVSTVDSLLPDTPTTNTSRLVTEELGVTYTGSRDPLESKAGGDQGTLYVWPVYMT